MTSFDPSRMLAFDLETTGRDPLTCRIVTAALVTIDGRRSDPVALLADPGVEIPAGATAIHGITTEQAREQGRPHDEVLAEVVTRLRRAWSDGLTVVVYNAPFDLTAIRHLEPSFTVDGLVFDPYVIDRDRRREKGKRTLTDICAAYGVVLDQAHEATADAVAAARVAWKQARRWPDLAEMAGPELMEYQAVAHYERQSSLAEYFRREDREDAADDVQTAWPMRG